jgi:hypothetical protein
MTSESSTDVLARQQEIVHRFAVRIKEQNCAGGTATVAPKHESTRRCYELLNECAMELAEANRAPLGRPGGQSAN